MSTIHTELSEGVRVAVMLTRGIDQVPAETGARGNVVAVDGIWVQVHYDSGQKDWLKTTQLKVVDDG